MYTKNTQNIQSDRSIFTFHDKERVKFITQSELQVNVKRERYSQQNGIYCFELKNSDCATYLSSLDALVV